MTDVGEPKLVVGRKRKRMVASFVRISTAALIALIFVVAVVPRLALVLSTEPFDTPDSSTYVTVAENIQQNFCVSRSDPASGACKPHWGGNQLPGYPAFIALAWAIGGNSLVAIVVLQAVAASLAIGFLAYAVLVYTRRRDMALAAGCLLALSPLEIGYARALLTEALAMTTTIWVLGELILSLAARRLRVPSLGIALIAAIFIRLDGVLLCLLAAGVGFYLHPPGLALRRGALLAAIVIAPLAAWTIRSVAEGLPPFPTVAAAEHDWSVPKGIHRWATSWIETTEQAAEFIYPINKAAYSSARVPRDARIAPAERKRAEALLGMLSLHDDEPVPASIDDAFATLAAERRAAAPVETYLRLPLQRALFLWSDPYPSFGWPIGFRTHESLEIARTIDSGGIAGLLAMALRYPVQSIGKLIIDGYRLVLLAIFVLLAIRSRHESFRFLCPIIALAAAYAVIRTVFFSAWIVETRYIVEAFPALETVCALGIASCFMARTGAPPPRS
jgi:hypothetical protein